MSTINDSVVVALGDEFGLVETVEVDDLLKEEDIHTLGVDALSNCGQAFIPRAEAVPDIEGAYTQGH